MSVMTQNIPTYHIGQVVRLNGYLQTNLTRLATACAAGATSLIVEDDLIASGYAGTDTLLIQSGRREVVTVSSVSSRTITLSSGTAFGHPNGASIGEVSTGTVTGRVELPDGTETAVSMTPTSGRYRGTYTPTQTGLHKWQLLSTGAVEAGTEGAFYVVSNEVANT